MYPEPRVAKVKDAANSLCTAGSRGHRSTAVWYENQQNLISFLKSLGLEQFVVDIVSYFYRDCMRIMSRGSGLL